MILNVLPGCKGDGTDCVFLSCVQVNKISRRFRIFVITICCCKTAILDILITSAIT